MTVQQGSRVWAEHRSAELHAEYAQAVSDRRRARIMEDFAAVNFGQAQRIGRSLAGRLGVRSLDDVDDIVAEVLAAIPAAFADWDPTLGPFGSWLWRHSHDAARRFVETSSGFGRGGSLAMRRASAVRRISTDLSNRLSRPATDAEIVAEYCATRSESITLEDVATLKMRGLVGEGSVEVPDTLQSPEVCVFGESSEAVRRMADAVDAASVGELDEMGTVFRLRFRIDSDPGDILSWRDVAREAGVTQARARLLDIEARRVIADWLQESA